MKPEPGKQIGTTASGNNIYVTSDSNGVSASPGSVVVVDQRKAGNPNMQVKRSYKTKNKNDQKSVVNAMQKYNKENPVTPAWTRTDQSLLTEWKIHNVAYVLHIKRSSTVDVDLDNKKGWVEFTWDTAIKPTIEKICS